MSETTALQLRIPRPKTSTACNGCKLQAQVDRPRCRACRQSGWGRAGHRQILSSACDLQLSLGPFSSSMSGNRRDERSMCEASVTLASRALRRATQSLARSKKTMSVFLMHPGAVSERPRLARPLEEHILMLYNSLNVSSHIPTSLMPHPYRYEHTDRRILLPTYLSQPNAFESPTKAHMFGPSSNKIAKIILYDTWSIVIT